MNKLAPQGAMVVIEARHLCVEMRGVKKPGALTVTSAIRGALPQAARREEFLDLLRCQVVTSRVGPLAAGRSCLALSRPAAGLGAGGGRRSSGCRSRRADQLPARARVRPVAGRADRRIASDQRSASSTSRWSTTRGRAASSRGSGSARRGPNLAFAANSRAASSRSGPRRPTAVYTEGTYPRPPDRSGTDLHPLRRAGEYRATSRRRAAGGATGRGLDLPEDRSSRGSTARSPDRATASPDTEDLTEFYSPLVRWSGARGNRSPIRGSRRGRQVLPQGAAMSPALLAAAASRSRRIGVDNDMLARVLETNDEWIRERSGIVTRFYVEPGVGASPTWEPRRRARRSPTPAWKPKRSTTSSARR